MKVGLPAKTSDLFCQRACPIERPSLIQVGEKEKLTSRGEKGESEVKEREKREKSEIVKLELHQYRSRYGMRGGPKLLKTNRGMRAEKERKNCSQHKGGDLQARKNGAERFGKGKMSEEV